MNTQDQELINYAIQQLDSLSQLDRAATLYAAQQIKEIVKRYGDHGSLAAAIIGIEIQTQYPLLESITLGKPSIVDP